MVFKKLRKKLKLGKFKRTGEVLLKKTKLVFKKKTKPKSEAIKLEPKKKFGEGPVSEFTPLEKVISRVTFGKGKGEGLTQEQKRDKATQRGKSIGGFAATSILGGAAIGGAAKLFKPVTRGLLDVSKGLPKQLGQIGKKINVDKLGKTAGLTRDQTKALAVRIGHERINLLARYAVNSKSISLTTKLLNFAKSPAGMVGIISSYPFAGFIKEEAIQLLGFASNDAKKEGDLEGLEIAIREQEEILDVKSWERLISLVPFANVGKQLADFFGAARVKLEEDKRILEKLRGEREFEGKSVGEEIAERDIEQEEKFAEIAEKQEERDRAFLEAQAERDIAERQDSAYFEVLRQMKSPFPEGTPVSQIDPEIVKLARESNLFLNQF